MPSRATAGFQAGETAEDAQLSPSPLLAPKQR
jgi:hypothetical protein